MLTDTLTTNITLRQYQIDCLNAIHDREASGVRRQIVTLPCGAGKTVILAELIASRPDTPALILVHRRELLQQAVAKLRLAGVEDVGVIQGPRNEFDHRVLVASVQTLSRPERLAQLPDNIALCIVDECHRSVASTFYRIIEHTGCGTLPDTLLLGVTATPERHQAKTEALHLADVFEKITFSYSIREAIADGWLVSPRGIHVRIDVDLDNLSRVCGDFQSKGLADAMERANAPAAIVEAYIEHAHGRCTIAFCSTVKAAHELRDEFRSWGISSETLHGELDTDIRAQMLADHAARKFEVLTSVNTLVEGIDCPIWDTAIVARPTLSRTLYIQSVGRILRPFPGKEDALVLDCVGASTKHKLLTVSELVKPDPESEQTQPEPEPEPEPEAIDDRIIPDIDVEGDIISEAVDLFASDDFEWLEVMKDRAWGINLAKEGLHIVLADDDEFHLIRNGYPGPVEHIETSGSPERLKGMVEGIVYAHNLEYLVHRGGQWRGRKPSPGRSAFSRKWGIDPDSFMNDGALADAISVAIGRSVIARFQREQALCRNVVGSR